MSRPEAAWVRFDSPREPFFAKLAVFVEKLRQPKLGRIIGKAVDVLLDGRTLGKPACDFPDILLQPANDNLVAKFGSDGHPAAEALRIQDLQQRGEAIRVAVVRRRGQEEAVLEAAGEIPDCAGDFRVNGVLHAARRGGVMSLVKDKQRARGKVPKVVTQAAGVGLVGEKAVRDEEPRMGRPGVNAVARARAAPGRCNRGRGFRRLGQIGPPSPRATEGALTAVWRSMISRTLLTQKQLAGDETGFDRLAKSNVVGDEQVDARQQQGFSKRFELVSIEADARPERRLKEAEGRLKSPSSNEACGCKRRSIWGDRSLWRRDRPKPRRPALRGQLSHSHKTSRGCPWASSSTHARRTSVASPSNEGGAVSSTR